MLRYHQSLTSRAERAILQKLCPLVPRWISSDGLTAIGVAGAGLAGIGFALADRGRIFPCLAIVGMILNWIGDSLDGTIARFRHCERPQYGLFVDLSADTVSVACITVGIGLSSFAHLVPALVILATYYLAMIVAMSICMATGVFRISFGKIGSTEIRLIIVVCALCIMILPIPTWRVFGNVLSIYDCIMLAVSAGMLSTVLTQMWRTAHELAIIDPPRS